MALLALVCGLLHPVKDWLNLEPIAFEYEMWQSMWFVECSKRIRPSLTELLWRRERSRSWTSWNELVHLVRERKNQLLNDNDGAQVELGSCCLAYLQQSRAELAISFNNWLFSFTNGCYWTNTPITDRGAVLSLNEREISFVNELNELAHVVRERMCAGRSVFWVSLVQQSAESGCKSTVTVHIYLFIYSHLTYRT